MNIFYNFILIISSMCASGAGMGLDNMHPIGKGLPSYVSISVTYNYVYLVVFLVFPLGSILILYMNDIV